MRVSKGHCRVFLSIQEDENELSNVPSRRLCARVNTRTFTFRKRFLSPREHLSVRANIVPHPYPPARRRQPPSGVRNQDGSTDEQRQPS